jgi:hypothetical protein
MVPYQPPHCGASWFDASILPISLLPQRGHFNSLSSLGPNGASTSKLDLHWRQVRSQVTIIFRIFSCDIAFEPDSIFFFLGLSQTVDLGQIEYKIKEFLCQPFNFYQNKDVSIALR